MNEKQLREILVDFVWWHEIGTSWCGEEGSPELREGLEKVVDNFLKQYSELPSSSGDS